MELTREKIAVTRALEALDRGLADLVNALAHSDGLCVLEGTGGLRRACEAFASIDYGMEDEVNQSVVCYGAVAASRLILKKAEAVNALKTDLKSVCAPLQNRRVRVPVKGDDGPTQAIPAVRYILRSIQRSDLNLLAAYRSIPVLAAPPVGGRVLFVRKVAVSLLHRTSARPKLLIRRAAQRSARLEIGTCRGS